MPLDAIETLYSEALRTGSDIISGNGVFVPIKGEQTIMEGKLPYGNDKSGVYKALLKRDLRQSLWGKLFKASLFTDYQYKNYEHFTNGEDGLLLYQVVRNISSFSLIDAPVYNYMQNAASSSQKRYKKNAIKGICAINRARHDLVKDYPELETDVNKCVTNVLCSLYSQRYDRDANLNDFLEEYGLKKYISLSNVFKYLQAKVIMKYAIRYLRNTF